MAISKSSSAQQSLISLSQNLAAAYCPGLHPALTTAAGNDGWTSEKLVQYGLHLAQGYGPWM